MSLLYPAHDDDEFAAAHLDAGFWMRVKWVHKLHAELKRLAEKHPEEKQQIEVVLSETKEWLNPK